MSCTPTYPFTIVKGNTFAWTIECTVGGVAYDISNYDFFFTAKIRKADLDADAVITQDWNTNIDLPSAVLGFTILELSATQTDIPAGDYYYDIKFKTPTGDIRTFLGGILTISESITNRNA